MSAQNRKKSMKCKAANYVVCVKLALVKNTSQACQLLPVSVTPPKLHMRWSAGQHLGDKTRVKLKTVIEMLPHSDTVQSFNLH